jgi:adenine deaminase
MARAQSLRLGVPIEAETFKISSAKLTSKIRVVELLNQTITAERVVAVRAPSGIVEANLYDDILKVAVFDRHPQFAEGRAWFPQRFRCQSRRRRVNNESR